MKKYLPIPKDNSRGFTLIEMLVVITLIAILSAVGMTTYANVQKDARDARRKTDIDVIANAMEANYNTAGGTYKAFTPSTFITGGTIPVDPLNGTARCGTGGTKMCRYCGSNSTAASRTAMATSENLAGGCPDANGTLVGASIPALSTAFEVCATLENGDGGAGTLYYCRTNQR